MVFFFFYIFLFSSKSKSRNCYHVARRVMVYTPSGYRLLFFLRLYEAFLFFYFFFGFLFPLKVRLGRKLCSTVVFVSKLHYYHTYYYHCIRILLCHTRAAFPSRTVENGGAETPTFCRMLSSYKRFTATIPVRVYTYI